MVIKIVGIYVRVSTEEQALNGFSINAQIEKLSSYCKLKNWEIFDVYKDSGISGKNIEDRIELKRLINDIKNNKVKNVLVYKIDRLTRSTKDLIELVELFNKYNCSFNSFTENIDTLSPTGRMFIKIIGIFAEFERENIVERVKLGLERKVREGYTIASKNISYGYAKIKGEKIQNICKFEAYIVRKIFNMYLDNYSFTSIANYLNKYGVKTKNNNKWTYKTIKKVLTNSTYIGKVRYGINKKNYFEVIGKHDSIITEDIFYLVQKKIKKRHLILYCDCQNKYSIKRIKYYSKKRKKILMYSKLYCRKCKKYINIKDIKCKSNEKV